MLCIYTAQYRQWHLLTLSPTMQKQHAHAVMIKQHGTACQICWLWLCKNAIGVGCNISTGGICITVQEVNCFFCVIWLGPEACHHWDMAWARGMSSLGCMPQNPMLGPQPKGAGDLIRITTSAASWQLQSLALVVLQVIAVTSTHKCTHTADSGRVWGGQSMAREGRAGQRKGG